MEIKTFVFNAFMENTYLLYDDTKSCVVVDPGCYEDYEFNELDAFISKHGLKVEKLINTHCHIDHVLGNHHVHTTYKVPLGTHPIEEAVLRAVKTYAPNYGFTHYEEVLPGYFFEEGEQITFGETILDILFVPGHSPGHVVLVDRPDNVCIGGDVLFKGSIGRTDLPGGDHNTLIQHIQEKMFALPDDMLVYPGHGPTTTIGEEKLTNPFCGLGAAR